MPNNKRRVWNDFSPGDGDYFSFGRRRLTHRRMHDPIREVCPLVAIADHGETPMLLTTWPTS
jgi:hypothetical protein